LMVPRRGQSAATFFHATNFKKKSSYTKFLLECDISSVNTSE
jgi:hypothetical protein